MKKEHKAIPLEVGFSRYELLLSHEVNVVFQDLTQCTNIDVIASLRALLVEFCSMTVSVPIKDINIHHFNSRIYGEVTKYLNHAVHLGAIEQDSIMFTSFLQYMVVQAYCSPLEDGKHKITVLIDMNNSFVVHDITKLRNYTYTAISTLHHLQ